MKARFLFYCISLSILIACSKSQDPLPSWENGDTKNAIMHYVQDVTNPSSPNFIPVEDRIATFDNDGTLWSEQPIYFQLFFAMDRVKALAKEHPEWKNEQPYKSILENNMKELKKQGYEGLIKMMTVTHTGMTTVEFEEIVKNWINTAEHPTKKKTHQKVYLKVIVQARFVFESHLNKKCSLYFFA